jgi:broad specificity phosphatase PhoE
LDCRLSIRPVAARGELGDEAAQPSLLEQPMPIARLAVAALLLILAGCAYMAPVQPAATFYVMRHLHTPAGATDPDLTAEGQRQAQLLANHFANEPPATIFVSNTKRAQQTAAPLAARLGITPITYDPRDTAGLLSEMVKEPPPVLVIGHSNTVPDIVAGLGGARPAPLTHEDFGDIWRIKGRSVTRSKLAGS